MARWRLLVLELGRAFADLLRSEANALGKDLARSARRLVGAVVILLVAQALGFWLFGMVLYLMVEVAALWLPRWGAVGSVAGLLALVTALTLWWGLRSLRAVETPGATVRRRLGEHVDWWRQRVLESEPAALPPEGDPTAVEEELP